MKYSTLELGITADAREWETNCQSLGMSHEHSVIGDSATHAQLTAFFTGRPDWIYFSGHYSTLSLYGDSSAINFKSDRVTVIKGNNPSNELIKGSEGSAGFQLHHFCSMVMWAGCSTLSDVSNIRTLRQLFDNPLLLGYDGSTGAAINIAMLQRFFQRIRPGQYGPKAVLDAWMEAANSYYGGGPIENMFRAVDISGQEWKIVNKQIIKGRKL